MSPPGILRMDNVNPQFLTALRNQHKQDRIMDSPLTDEEIFEALNNPNWADPSIVHDWRNYVPTAVKGYWSQLSADARIVSYYQAWLIADREEWD